MNLSGFAKKQSLLVISAILALVSLFFVPFETVLEYDYTRILRTICMLLLFLLVVAGLKECKALDVLAERCVSRVGTARALCLLFVALPFFSAMLFSNDVSLLTFVPMAIAILDRAGLRRLILRVIILQTIAANIGSTLTPFGNPHNLYIYNLMDHYGFSIVDYELALIPIVAVGAFVVLALTMLIKNAPLEAPMGKKDKVENPRNIYVLIGLFALAVISVIGVIPLYIALIVIVAAIALLMPSIFKKVDYGILLVFLFLFIFANGVTEMSWIHQGLSAMMAWDPMLTTVFVSQFTSNVSSCILLQPFTSDWAAVLVGADIGGFGTPIASMACIITLKFYLLEEDSSVKDYMKVFLLFNLIMLAVLIPTYYLFG